MLIDETINRINTTYHEYQDYKYKGLEIEIEGRDTEKKEGEGDGLQLQAIQDPRS